MYIGVKNDLRKDMSRDWRRPRYVYESGRIVLGEFETDGDFLFANVRAGKIRYTVVNLTKALYKKSPLMEVEDSIYGLAFDASRDRAGKGKLRYWRAETVVR